MPLYFAYGSNMIEAAMRQRCPSSKPLGPARLARHRFTLMPEGFASVTRDPNSNVHGVLYDLALKDVPALDRYEDVGRGLYAKEIQPVLRSQGAPCRALVYIGKGQGGHTRKPPAGYMDEIAEAARFWQLPDNYVAFLDAMAGREAAPVQSQFRAIKRPDFL